MSRNVRVIVVNTDEEVASDLRAVLLSIEGVKIVAEIDEPALLGQALDQFPAEVVLVHLDPTPAAMMDVVAPLIEQRKDQIAAIAITEDRDAELVMRAMRAGMREFLWKPFPPEQLADILQRLATDAAASGSRQLGRLIVVVGTTGGVGATQLATNLAVELAQFEHWDAAPRPGVKPRVAVVDLDFRFGQVAMQLDAQPTYTIAELCESHEAIDPQMIERAMCKHSTGVHVLARPADLQQAESSSAGQCAAVLAALQEHYDFVLADLPARFDASARSVFDMSDTYLLVFQLMVPAVRAADRTLTELGRCGYAPARVRLVCNRCCRDGAYLEESDVEATLHRKIDFRLPDDWRSSAVAVNMGAPLLISAPKSKLRQAYRQIALALAGPGQPRGSQISDLRSKRQGQAAAESEERLEVGAPGGKKKRFSLFAGSPG